MNKQQRFEAIKVAADRMEISAELFVFRNGAGELHLPDLQGGEPLTIALAARFVRLLRLLQEASEFDEQLPRSVRGFRHAAALAAAYDPHGPALAPDKETIVAYLSHLSRKLESLVGERPFLERVSGRGARLASPLKIVLLPANWSDF